MYHGIFIYLRHQLDNETLVLRIICKGAALRAGFPKDAKSHPVYGVLDDNQLQALLKRGKAWTSKSWQCLQTMQGGRPMASSLLSNLLDEAKSLKINLFPEVCPSLSIDLQPSFRQGSMGCIKFYSR